MQKIGVFIALASLLWAACTTSDVPDGGLDVPVFHINIDSVGSSDSVGLTAGLDGIYLFTKVTRGSDSVFVLSGTFADAKCPSGDCPGSVRFEFRNDHAENFIEPDFLFNSGQNWIYKTPFTSDPPWYNTVAVRWETSDGTVLRSDIFQPQQDSSVFFSVQNAGPWEPNERGEKTWKMEVNFSCWMIDSIQITQRKVFGNGVIAVAYR